ncbi:hypothetical protein ACIQF6_34115 [Kitasatospora sp. NPDC092948]|uniref:hypothetical protein n=1 Tax=Kitasatospora sp. NPDC092948 TaxID=3364088 RepID=UPI0037F50C87
MNVTEFLRLLQADHNNTAARADHLREQIDQLTSALAEVEARLAEIVTTGKVIGSLIPLDHGQDPAKTATVYQQIVTAFNEHPRQVFRVRELHELLGLPTDKPSVNITRSRLGRLIRQRLLTQPGRGLYQKRT